jgi:hypothetical protein
MKHTKNQVDLQTNERRRWKDAKMKNAQMLKLSDKDFKAAIIKCFNGKL